MTLTSPIVTAQQTTHFAVVNLPRSAFIVGGLYSRANGIAWIMRGLANGLARLGSPPQIFAADCLGRQSIGEIFDAPVRWNSARGLWMGGLSWSPRLRRMLAARIRNLDVVHQHSLWMLPNAYASQAARRWDKPVLFTTHGFLEPWALDHSRWKKRILRRLFQDRDLADAACIHVNSQQEHETVRRLGLKNPVATIPNGVELPEFSKHDNGQFAHRYPETAGKRIVLFMGRLHKKKGLDLLIQAWRKIHRTHDEWHLVVAGPDRGFECRAREMVDSLGLKRHVTLTGDLRGDAKRLAMAAAEIFVLPSHSEGFSMAVLEAMAAQLPVLITPGCNFPEVEAVGAGLVAPASVEGIEQALRDLLSLSDTNRTAMGERGRAMIEARYTWEKVAAEMAHVYRWLTGEVSTPPCVCD